MKIIFKIKLYIQNYLYPYPYYSAVFELSIKYNHVLITWLLWSPQVKTIFSWLVKLGLTLFGLGAKVPAPISTLRAPLIYK